MRPSGGRRKTDWRRIVLGLLLALFCGQFCSRQVSAMEERKQSNSYGLQTEKDADETNAGTVSGTSDPVSQELVSDMSFEQVQKLMDEMLGEESFSMETALKNMISGETVFSKEAVQSFLRSLFFDRLEQERANFMRILLLVLAAALFSNFAAVFENGQIGDVSFYMIYLLLFTILMNSYQSLGISMGKQLDLSLIHI